MKRFRVTLLVICLLLAWLGYSDLKIHLRNQEPLELTLQQLSNEGAPREWLSISGGYQDLLQAINMSGTMEIDSFLVPLKQSPADSEIQVWFETRDPQIISTLKHYYFKLDNEEQRLKYLRDNQEFFYAKRQVTGMTVDNLIADTNRDKLQELLQTMGMAVSDDIIFISESKQPTSFRGYFFAAMALVGLLKLFRDMTQGNKGRIEAEDRALKE